MLSVAAPRNAGVWLTLESWQQRQNIFPFDEPQVISTEHAALLQALDVLRGSPEGKVGPEHDLRHGHDLAQRRHGRRVRCLRGVVVELACLAQETLRELWRELRCFAMLTNRSTRNGIVPPACEKMSRMFG